MERPEEDHEEEVDEDAQRHEKHHPQVLARDALAPRLDVARVVGQRRQLDAEATEDGDVKLGDGEERLRAAVPAADRSESGRGRSTGAREQQEARASHGSSRRRAFITKTKR